MPGELKAGRYELTKEIGRGGMGVVYSARDARLGRRVALKMIPAELIHNTELRRRLGQEARAASRLSHPGIATVFDFIDEAEESFIVYEYIEGVTLRQKLGRDRFSAERILDMGIQLAEALAAAHENGIIHRDLKPENVMVTPASDRTGRVKILDFGLAKHYKPLTQAGAAIDTGGTTASTTTVPGLLVGTVNYMAPEQIEGERADPRTDLYALGLVLYEMTTGANPFVGKTPTSTIANILKLDAPPVRERNTVAPPELDRILRKCLRKRREERYQSARELAVDLSNLRQDIAGAAGAVVPETAAAQPGRWRRLFALESGVPLEIPRRLARALFLLIQVAYLGMYAAAFYAFQKGSSPSGGILGAAVENRLFIWILMAALAGTPLRLYLLSAVGFDYSNTGRLFRQMFPLAVLFDIAWSVSPLLLYQKLGLPALLMIPALAYLPFSQRTLVLSAYAASGGRTSGVRTPSSP
jgi:predicted Ser/Thr protein kinase